MKKTTVLAVILLLVSVSFLCGCNEETSSTGDTDKVELVSSNVETINFYGGGEYKKYSGVVKNIAGYKINTITIKVRFYDSNNNLLETKTDHVYDLENSYTDDFFVIIHYNHRYYDNIDYVEFEFFVS